MNIKELYNKESECCGCAACEFACKKNIIEMHKDSMGFSYPIITDESKCVNCKNCIKSCPIKQKETNSEFIAFYAGSIKERNELYSCASGGAATELALGFIKEGGVVYGAAYTDNYIGVEYIRADCPEQINRLKTSKYVQADMVNIYNCIESDLKNKKEVLFIGLPCCVAAIKNVFKKYDNLYTAELICHGPTSVYVHQQYIENLKTVNKSDIKFFSVRHKLNGKWKPFYIKAEFNNSKAFYRQFHKSSYGEAFRYMKRPSCYHCAIKGKNLVGDIMLGDYHYAEKGMKAYNPRGTSSILVHNKKGQDMLSRIDADNFEILPIKKEYATANRAIYRSIERPQGADEFEKVFCKSGLSAASKLSFVRISGIKRNVKNTVLRIAIKIKRIIFGVPGTLKG